MTRKTFDCFEVIYHIDFKGDGGERGIRTPGTGLGPYNGLANRRLQPLGHLSARVAFGIISDGGWIRLMLCSGP